MLLLVALAILALLAFGAGFVIHWLFIAAVIVALRHRTSIAERLSPRLRRGSPAGAPGACCRVDRSRRIS
jgi:hypothetical protein